MTAVDLGLRGAVVPVAAPRPALTAALMYLELRAAEGEGPIPDLTAAFA